MSWRHSSRLIQEAMGAKLTPPANNVESAAPVYQEIVDFLTSSPTLKQVVAFKISDSAQDQLEELLYRNREEELTQDERTELETYLQFSHLVSRLKASEGKSMSLPQSQVPYSIEEYLALERESEERHEYLDGQIYAMAGESEEHGDICTNLVRELSSQLRGTPCRAWSKDTKVRSGPTPKPYQTTKGLFSYPDVVVVCGERQYHDQHRDVLLNPTVIIEVLSPSTEAFDRGEKFRRYRTYLESLTDYVLVSQSMPLIEHYRRKPNDEWILAAFGHLEGSLHLASIECTLRLTEVYDRVTFPVESSEDPDEE